MRNGRPLTGTTYAVTTFRCGGNGAVETDLVAQLESLLGSARRTGHRTGPVQAAAALSVDRRVCVMFDDSSRYRPRRPGTPCSPFGRGSVPPLRFPVRTSPQGVTRHALTPLAQADIICRDAGPDLGRGGRARCRAATARAPARRGAGRRAPCRNLQHRPRNHAGLHGLSRHARPRVRRRGRRRPARVARPSRRRRDQLRLRDVRVVRPATRASLPDSARHGHPRRGRRLCGAGQRARGQSPRCA